MMVAKDIDVYKILHIPSGEYVEYWNISRSADKYSQFCIGKIEYPYTNHSSTIFQTRFKFWASLVLYNIFNNKKIKLYCSYPFGEDYELDVKEFEIVKVK